MLNRLKGLLSSQSGSSAAEYALIVAVVGIGIGAASLALGANTGAAVNDGSGDLYAMNFAPEGGGSSSSGGGSCTKGSC